MWAARCLLGSSPSTPLSGNDSGGGHDDDDDDDDDEDGNATATGCASRCSPGPVLLLSVLAARCLSVSSPSTPLSGNDSGGGCDDDGDGGDDDDDDNATATGCLSRCFPVPMLLSPSVLAALSLPSSSPSTSLSGNDSGGHDDDGNDDDDDTATASGCTSRCSPVPVLLPPSVLAARSLPSSSPSTSLSGHESGGHDDDGNDDDDDTATASGCTSRYSPVPVLLPPSVLAARSLPSSSPSTSLSGHESGSGDDDNDGDGNATGTGCTSRLSPGLCWCRLCWQHTVSLGPRPQRLCQVTIVVVVVVVMVMMMMMMMTTMQLPTGCTSRFSPDLCWCRLCWQHTVSLGPRL